MQLVTFAIVFWENPSGSNTVGIINAAGQKGWFPSIFGNMYGLNVIVVLIITLGMYVYMKYSKQGYEIAVVGESQNTARYAGINVKKVIIRTMMLSGAICGIAGCLIVSGASHTISTSTAGGRGFTAIIVAWMSKFNPFAMILVKMKAGEGGRTFGSVSTKEIAVAAKAQLGMELDKKKMQLPEPIRTFGVTEVAIKLHPKVVGKFNVHVVEE